MGIEEAIEAESVTMEPSSHTDMAHLPGCEPESLHSQFSKLSFGGKKKGSATKKGQNKNK